MQKKVTTSTQSVVKYGVMRPSENVADDERGSMIMMPHDPSITPTCPQAATHDHLKIFRGFYYATTYYLPVLRLPVATA